jgi:hypothetical protein
VSTLSERLDLYAALPPDERASVDRDVADSGSTTDAGRLAEARAFAALVDAAADARPGRPVSADDVSAYLTDLSLGLVPADADRVAAALDADPALRAEADRVRARLDVLHEGAESPLAQFERLSGHRLDPPTEAPARTLRDPRTDRASERPRAADRAAAAAPRMRLVSVRRVLVAATVVLVAYGGLSVASTRQLSERYRVAELGDLASYAPPTMRGAATDALPARLDAALDAVAGARRSTLGLFPHYDAAALDAAAAELTAIAGATDSGSDVSQEARLALARVHLYQERDAEAVRILSGLVREQRYRAPEARRLLDFVRTQDGG